MSNKIRGRGAASNTSGRFDLLKIEMDDSEGFFEEKPGNERTVKTQFFKDTSRTIVTENDSPDIDFRYSMNFYRGCEHGCAYCYARPTHEYLGMSAGLDFESKIFVKENAPELLREKLMSPRWQADTIIVSGNTDCYQPAERKFRLTRRCLEILAEFRNPVSMITKNSLVLRDLDILKIMARDNLVTVMLSVTSLDDDLQRQLEPRTSSPRGRLEAIEGLAKAGIPVGVNVAPVIPGLTDHEIPNILKAAKDAGASFAGFTIVRLPHSVSTIFSEWLDTNRPDSKSKVLSYIRDLRGGKLNDPNIGSRMRGSGPRAENIEKMFKIFVNKFALNKEQIHLSKDKFRRPGDQLDFFSR
jgi:DNA repair photolyase